MNKSTTLQRQRRELLINSGFASIVSLVVKLRGVILLPIITRSAGVADYGIWVQITALLAIIPPVFGLNLHQALARFTLNDDATTARGTYRRLAAIVTLTSGLGAAAMAGLALHLTASSPRLSAVLLQCAGLLPPVTLCKLGVSYLRGRGQVKRASLLDASLNLLAVGFAATAFALGYGVEGAILGLLLAFTLVAVASAAPKFLSVASPGVQRKPVTPWREYLHYALPAIPAALADWALFALDRYALGLYAGNTIVGIYGASYSLALLLRFFGTPVTYALMPAIGRLWDQNKEQQALRLTRDALLLTTFASVLVGAFLCRNGPWLLGQLSTEQIADGSKPLLPLLLGGLILWMSTCILFQLFIAQKRPGEMTRVLFVAATVNALGNAILIPHQGAQGAALATLIAYAVALLYTWVRLRGALGSGWGSKRTVKGLLCLIVLGVATVQVPHVTGWLPIVAEGLAFSVGFAALLFGSRTLTVHSVLGR